MKNDNCKDDKKSINWTSLQACDQMFSNPFFGYFLLTVMYLFSTQTSLAMRVKKCASVWETGVSWWDVLFFMFGLLEP